MGMSLFAPDERACGWGWLLSAVAGWLASTRLMLLLLAGRRQQTPRHQQTEHLAQLLSLSGCESIPEWRQRWRRCGSRRRRGGTDRLELSDMEYLLVLSCGVPGTTGPVATTPPQRF